MSLSPYSPSVHNVLFQPLLSLLPHCSNFRHCNEFSDQEFVSLGVLRVLHESKSGRAFLQQHGFRSHNPPSLGNYFEAYKSQRRLALVRELQERFCSVASDQLPDALAQFQPLAGYDIYAGDGHWHAAAAHDPVDQEGRKHASGSFMALSLRNHTLRHLAVGRGKKEHDMHVLKRLTAILLRQGAPKGRKVIYVWDKAGIDFRAWYSWKSQHGIYFISLEKENMKLARCGQLDWEREDPMNAGILDNEQVGGGGVMMRRITYVNPEDGKRFVVLTNVTELPPGLVVFLYKLRWDIEKVFDEKKNKLEEKKAWASTETAKAAQSQLICLTHNAILLMELRLQKEGIQNQAEDKRRDKRLEKAIEAADKLGRKLPSPVKLVKRATSRSVKLIRWIRSSLLDKASWSAATPRLIGLYATM